MVKIVKPKNKSGKTPVYCECEILADKESEIQALEEVVHDGRLAVIPTPGSMAYTADMSVVYQLSPSGVWTKVV